MRAYHLNCSVAVNTKLAGFWFHLNFYHHELFLLCRRNGPSKIQVTTNSHSTTRNIYHCCVGATKRPPQPPREDKWHNLMEEISKISCQNYRSTINENPEFLTYFHEATPQAELGFLNIGSRPIRRKSSIGIGHLQGIPWVFGWTQTRFVLPSWLRVGAGLKVACEEGHAEFLREMYREWPFFQSTIDLIEMVLGKADIPIAKLYDEVLVSESRRELGAQLRRELMTTEMYVLIVSGHEKPLEGNRSLRKLIELRLSYLNTINMLQVEILKRLRRDHDNVKLRDDLLITINGITAGMRNTG